MRKTTVIGALGPKLDRGTRPDRWGHWRPSVSVCQHEDFVVDRFVLLCEPKFNALAEVVSQDIRSVSPETEVDLRFVEFGDPWDFEQVYSALFDFVKGFDFDTERDDYLIHMTTGTHVTQICMFLLTESRHLPGRILQTAPPRQNSSSAGEMSVIDLDLARYDRIAQRFEVEQDESLEFLKSGIATRNKTFNRMVEQIEHVAIHASDPILLMGPTGAGKSHLARRIFDLKKLRRQVAGSFIDINCATLRGDTATSTLFGHRKGAFTGATSDRKGLLVEADGGVLFLDEIGELGLDEQAMLLRAIEDHVFLPVGSDRESRSDFQLICGTNRDLQVEVRAGRFREDLLARIHLWTFRLPGLADRREDIEPNLQYELDSISRTTGRHVRFNNEAKTVFLEFAQSRESRWSGNFRDLNAAIRRMSTMSRTGRITVDEVREELERLSRSWEPAVPPEQSESLADILSDEELDKLDLFDRVQLDSVVQVCLRSKTLSDAGRQLFAVSRKEKKSSNDADRLRKYLAKFDLSWKRLQELSAQTGS